MGWILCAPLISEMVHHKDGVVGPHPAVICFGRSWLDSWSEFFFSYLFLKKITNGCQPLLVDMVMVVGHPVYNLEDGCQMFRGVELILGHMVSRLGVFLWMTI